MGLLKLNIQYFAEGTVTIAMDLDTKRFDEEIKATERKLNDMVADYETLSKSKGFNEQSNDAIMLRQNIEKLNNKLVDLKKKQDDVGKIDMSQIPTQLSNIGSSMEGIIKKVARWGLAIFGIRSAYNFITGSISTLSGYNEQISTDVEYIRYAIASMLQPVIETIIKLAYKLLTYTAYIAKAWFGVNIFANATAKSFRDTNKAVKNTNKSAKELQKTLAGFDEMNILQQDGSTTLGGGGGGITVPSVDLSNWENVEIPKWIKWIADNKNIILDFFIDLVAVIATVKIASFLNYLIGINTVLTGMSGLPLFAMLGGIAITLLGIYETISSVIKFIADPTWENFTRVLSGLETVLIGVGVAMIALNASNPIGWIAVAVGVVGKIVDAFAHWGKKAETTTEKLRDTKQATDDLREAQEKLANQTSSYTNAVKNAEEKQKALEEAEKKNKMSGKELFEAVQIGTLNYKDMNEVQREVFDAYVQNLEAQERLTEETNKFTNAQNNANDASGRLSGAVYQETGKFDSYFETLMNGFANGEVSADQFYRTLDETLSNMDKDARKTFYENLPKNVRDGIKISEDEVGNFPYVVSTQFNSITDTSKRVFENDIPNQIENGLDPNKYNGAFAKFKNSWNNMINSLSTNINIGANLISMTVNKAVGRAKGGIYYPSKLPKLAMGGIINQPGRGVPYHGAIIGERGAEAVVPLTDSQQMQLLGETIGRYITVNTQMNNYMNGRLISRELQKVQNDSDFAYNR